MASFLCVPIFKYIPSQSMPYEILDQIHIVNIVNEVNGAIPDRSGTPFTIVTKYVDFLFASLNFHNSIQYGWI